MSRAKKFQGTWTPVDEFLDGVKTLFTVAREELSWAEFDEAKQRATAMLQEITDRIPPGPKRRGQS